MRGARAKGGVRESSGCEAWEYLADAVLTAVSVQVCPYGPTCGGRLLSGLRRTVVSKEGLPDFWGGNTEVRGANAIRCLFNALGPATCLQTVAPTAGKQPEFTSGVKRSRRRASRAARTACLAQTGSCGHSGEGKYRPGDASSLDMSALPTTSGKVTRNSTKAQPQGKSLRSRLLFCMQKIALTEFPLHPPRNAADGRHQCMMSFWIFKRASHCSPKVFRSCFCETSVDDMRQ